VGDGTTILDVLERESNLVGEDYARETIGPCISMPRLLYGSYEDKENYNNTSIYNENMLLADIGLSIKDFVTLRYKWHAIPESRIVNKFQKTLIDVSRIPDIILQSGHEAENIHVPLKYYCRKDPPRYSTSYFRVNHYLDSFEAYSYRRNDARSSMRRCRDCYDEKGKDAAKAKDNDMQLWLKSFVQSVGTSKAKQLLEGAGHFPNLNG